MTVGVGRGKDGGGQARMIGALNVDGLLGVCAHAGSAIMGLGFDKDGLNDDGLDGYVGVNALAARAYFGNFIDHGMAGSDLAKYGVAPAAGGFVLVVQKVVVGHVDEKLAGGRVWGIQASHSHAVALVFEAVVGFAVDGFAGGFGIHVGVKATTLDHKAIDNTMKNGAIVMALTGIGDEIGYGLRGFGFIEPQGNVAHIGADDGLGVGLGDAGCQGQ